MLFISTIEPDDDGNHILSFFTVAPSTKITISNGHFLCLLMHEQNNFSNFQKQISIKTKIKYKYLLHLFNLNFMLSKRIKENNALTNSL